MKATIHLMMIFLLFPSVGCNNGIIDLPPEPTAEWEFIGLGEESITAIAVDPYNPKVIYAGSSSDFSAGTTGKLFKSTDGGESWDTLLVGQGFMFMDIVIDPKNTNVIYALPHQVIKSVDGGETWQVLTNGMRINPETRAASLAIDPENSEVLYAGTGGFGGGSLYKSIDGGESWVDLYESEETTPGLRDGVVSLAIDPTNTHIIYAGTAWRGLLVKSIDGGETWFKTGLGETGQFIHDILIDANESSRVYSGINFKGIFFSEDGGLNWRDLNEGLPENISVMKIEQSKIKNKKFIVTTSGDNGWIYQSSQIDQWDKLGIDFLRRSYYYSDLKLVTATNDLYFGNKGIYRLRLWN